MVGVISTGAVLATMLPPGGEAAASTPYLGGGGGSGGGGGRCLANRLTPAVCPLSTLASTTMREKRTDVRYACHMALEQQNLTSHSCARLLGCSAAKLRENVGDTPLTAELLDTLRRQPPTWLMEARADYLLASAVASVEASLDEALAATEATLSSLEPSTLSSAEVAEMLGLQESHVQAFEPRRGWTADAVAELLRTQPAWTLSPQAARDGARKQAARVHASAVRRSATARAKANEGERNRAKWAEIAGVSIEEVPESMTKPPTAQAIERFFKRLPSWASDEVRRTP